MCLAKVLNKKESLRVLKDFKKIEFGYKIFYKDTLKNGKIVYRSTNFNFNTHYKRNKWYKNKSTYKILRSNLYEKYFNGFHVYLSKEDATNIYSYKTVKKVKIGKILSVGKQSLYNSGYTITTDKIKIL